MECEICGSTNFYKESGYFYCNECQTQSQEVQEHVFEEEVTNVKGIKKVRKDKTAKLDSKITSWECYNIVMCSLTEQLINLGADKNLKPIVKCLWMKYLQKLEIFDLKRNAKPRLQLVNSKRDSDILYGVLPKKRKRKKSSDESSVSLDSSSTRRERSKKKRALVQAQYEEFSQKSTQDTSSLHNETLSSLKSPSEKSDKSEEALCFSRYSNKELRKKISSRHYRKHKLDKKRILKCHKLTYQSCSAQYKYGVHFLSPIKLYCVLYLGLLINRDEMQLGDLFRFIREGHLSFNNYTELFPEEYTSKLLNIHNNTKNNLFSNKCFRITAAKIAIFLDITTYIKVIDLTALCQRYSNEMNLPDDVYVAVINMISKTNPKLTFNHKSKIIPNYEGRAMSIILFTLKLLFGLDGITEWEMSKYAQSVNNYNINKPKMFDIIKWIEYVGYRNFLICEHHFPSMYLGNSDKVDSDLFLKYIKSQEIKPNENVKLTREMDSYKELLTKIQEYQNDDYTNTIKFEPSLTPFLEYSRILNSPKYNLNHTFKNNSLDFLLRPNKYLLLVGDNLQLKHGGANDNWIIEDFQTYATMKTLSTGNRKLIPIEITKSGSEKDIDETIYSKSKVLKKRFDPQYVQQTHDKCLQHIFRENKMYVKRISKQVELEFEDEDITKSDYNIHYHPYERYWLHLLGNIHYINENDFNTYFNKHPGTFKLIFNECARIIEQTNQELFCEFQFSELFLVFSATYYEKDEKCKKQKLLGKGLRYFVNRAKTFW